MASASDTIYALSTAIGKSAIAVVRLSGPLSRFATETISGGALVERKMQLRDLRDQSGELLDRALVSWFKAPHSYTGEEMAELYLHGGRAVSHGVLECLSRFEGLRAAEAGEFTYRAFLGGRMDLSEVEGIADLLGAETALQRSQALRQASGSFRAVIDDLSREITLVRARLEATIDFSDEVSVPQSLIDDCCADLHAISARIDRQLEHASAGERLRDGYRVVLAGHPNAGKSSLLNALAQRDVAIVSDEAGTTRDVLEVHLDLKGVPLTVIDTAGFRVASGTIEQQGQERAKAAMARADLVLWLHAVDDPDHSFPDELEGIETPVLLRTKADLGAVQDGLSSQFSEVWSVSVRDDGSVAQFLVLLRARALEKLSAATTQAVPTRLRHKEALGKAQVDLQQTIRLLERAAPTEIAAEHLRLASGALEMITGRVQPDDLLGVIFAEFCIGK